ncbi:D-alanyl-D-alanine carboxypeptidase/D-alanyl-D-alanine-endopeptidase [Propioniciclava soli]|uniref:D-alanyl-D-alanine carboxypeptidase/D-alanyl-D-alanine endopeptidase n=1 Tax=Propioniciclava soli TaxID=2775081 RepID=UPI001E641C2A
MARRRGWVWPTVTWIAVLTVGVAVWVVRFPVAQALDTDPRVGVGHVAARPVADAPDAVLPVLPAPSVTPTSDPATPVPATPVPDPGTPDPDTPNPAAVAARLAAIPNPGGGDIVGVVLDARTGAEIHRIGDGVRTPASSMKVLSGVVALDVLGPETRFATTALLTADAGTVVLRGGGDPLLTSAPAAAGTHPQPASLQELAAATSAALQARGIGTVALDLDATRFGGPAWNPEWPDIFATSVAPITALTADHARPDPASAVRDPDPARFAATRFAEALRSAGIAVTAVNPAATPGDAVELAHVESPPVRALVGESLLRSDNDTAETLTWQVAVARGRPATPADAAAVLAEELQRLGLWTDGMVVHDGNGIAGTNQVSPDALARAVALGIAHDDLRALATGLPVAGVTGTLAERYTAPDSLAGRGVVRAKTGTIRGVNTLTGYTVTADGHPLVFAFMVSGGAGQTSARAWLDAASAALASCGC